MNRNLKDAERRAKELRAKLPGAIETPSNYGPVYQPCQRIFRKRDDLVLNRDRKIRSTICRKALTRFLHGCPPRKKGDTSFGETVLDGETARDDGEAAGKQLRRSSNLRRDPLGSLQLANPLISGLSRQLTKQ